ncbi:rhomboid family intramembrane serine protease [Maribacter hydrothermalis]|uniref:Rhomboid family intramembrane serine protease n=1 Tax=Maribacter hydrothermalis TaxID=1836467 RepID=A0A1B7ZDR0_9FLAO|nr:rhomboid family intramembrane serine protease [Maribacter hydrothermalis]APQ18450.1 rhomboid family intramembrane serine protease [Maribacter hydrothermalis]OBR41343.1 rhomboid family intramembrane serine protease [Maribacter hydrothermalis]
MAQPDLKYQFSKLNVAEKLIAINVLVFIVNSLVPFLLGISKNAIVQWFELPANIVDIAFQPWSIVTYSLFHGGIGHLFWNMLLVYFVGRIFLNLFDAKRFLNVYILGVILGGLFFVLGYNIFPAFFNTNAYLIGASAGASAVLIFICTYLPNQEVRIVFFNVKLWIVGAVVVLTDLIQLPMSNSGGHLAHLGGAFLGYLYASQLLKGNDIGSGFSKFMDSIVNMFKGSEKKGPLKTVYKNKSTANNSPSVADYDKKTHQKKIDAILDKISKSGYESLSKAEKDFLFKAGKEN